MGKKKCDEQKPICTSCLKREVVCKYPPINIVQFYPQVLDENYKNDPRKISEDMGSSIDISPQKSVLPWCPTMVSATQSFRRFELFSNQPIESYLDQESLLQNTNMNFRDLDPLINLPPQAHFDYFTNYSSQRLVVLPTDPNPFSTLLPKLALNSRPFYDLIVACGASHKALLLGCAETSISRALVDRCHSYMVHHNNFTPDGALLFVALLSQLEADIGHLRQWQECAVEAIQIVKVLSKSKKFSEYIEAEDCASILKLAALKLVGSDIVLGNIDEEYPLITSLDLSFWPLWPDSQADFITGIPPNAIPLFAEVADMIHLSKNWRPAYSVFARALKAIMRLNDGISATNLSGEIFVLSKLYYLSFKVHLYRRVLRFPSHHPHVRHTVACMLTSIESGIPECSFIHSRMPFVMTTLCCECDLADNKHRKSLKRRLKSMDGDGFALNRHVREVLEQNWNDMSGLMETFSSITDL